MEHGVICDKFERDVSEKHPEDVVGNILWIFLEMFTGFSTVKEFLKIGQG